jgi:3',5'-cyclic AMP phosphodiesterase CpdA
LSTRVLHVSDLHIGARRALHEPELEAAIAELVERVDPALVLATGDLAHRGRRSELEAAAHFLRGLGPPLLVVPGNHDIPYIPPARFTNPWREFERQWQTIEPVHATEELHVVGLNSVRPWRHQSGAIRDSQLAAAAERLGEASPGALRVVALHHQLVGAPWRTRKKPVAHRSHVLAELVGSGAELIVGGHVHQGAVSERHEFEVVEGEARGVVVATAPGLGRPRPHRQGEARGVLVYSADERRLRVETYIWGSGRWELTALRVFPRGANPLSLREDGRAAGGEQPAAEAERERDPARHREP